MKKTFLTLLTTVALLGTGEVKAANSVLQVKGTLKNFGDSALVFIHTPGEAGTRKDTVLLKDGKFSFSLKINKVSDVEFVSPDVVRGAKGKYLTFIAVPNETMELNGDANESFTITGSKFYKEFREIDLAVESAQKELDDFIRSLNTRMEKGESQEVLMKEYEEKSPILKAKVTNASIDFIKKHPGYEANVYTIAQLHELEEMEAAIKLLAPAVREGRMKPYYEVRLNQLREKKESEERAAKMQAAGVEAPNFTLNDLNGQPLSLSSLRGQYVVLDFWGSWCGWCIKGFPKMKEYYAKYKGKFEILGIDCNDPLEKWKEAVKKHELPWLHVYNTKESKVLSEYAIQGFPTKIVIGPDGKIVKTVVGEDPAFYTLLDELFGK